MAQQNHQCRAQPWRTPPKASDTEMQLPVLLHCPELAVQCSRLSTVRWSVSQHSESVCQSVCSATCADVLPRLPPCPPEELGPQQALCRTPQLSCLGMLQLECTCELRQNLTSGGNCGTEHQTCTPQGCCTTMSASKQQTSIQRHAVELPPLP